MSPLLLRCCNNDSFRALRRLSYGRWLIYGMSLVARVWTFSISTLSRLNLGCQITFPYSKCGRTIVVSLGPVTLPKHVIVALIGPIRFDDIDTALETWSWNVSSSSIYTPKSLSFLVSFNNCEFIWYVSLLSELPRWRLLHFASLNPSCHLFDHSTRLSRSSCTHRDLLLS